MSTQMNEDNGPKYPEIEVELIGQSGNAFMILGLMNKALRKGGVPQEERDAFQAEATSGDYDHLLRTCVKWVNVS